MSALGRGVQAFDYSTNAPDLLHVRWTLDWSTGPDRVASHSELPENSARPTARLRLLPRGLRSRTGAILEQH